MDTHYHKAQWGTQGKRVRTSMSYWLKPFAWNKQTWRECLSCGKRGKVGAGAPYYLCPCGSRETKPTRQRVFCASLADVFEDNPQVADWRGELFQLIDRTPNLDWMLLTKRADRIFSLGTDAVGEIFDNWLARHPNVWLGVTVENQKTVERIEHLSKLCAHVKFVSLEPMLEPINDPILRRADWLIVGGESGKNCRPFNWDWARDIRDQCKTAASAFCIGLEYHAPNPN